MGTKEGEEGEVGGGLDPKRGRKVGEKATLQNSTFSGRNRAAANYF